jgi:hypothetical protein
MSQLDDFELVKEPSTDPEDSRGSGLWAVVLAAIFVLGAAIAYYYWAPGEPAQKPAASSSQPRPAAEPTRGPAEPGEDIVVPPLEESDDLVRDLVRRLSEHPTIAAWLTTDGLIRNFTVVTVNIANGSHPERHLRRLAPSTPFIAAGTEGNLTVDPRSYARYDRYADAVSSIDARGAARLYATLKPRIEEAYAELGEPAATFDDVLERAMMQMLRVPVVEGPIRLTPKPVSYAYADPRLEGLTLPQKHLLRMGPRNVAMIQNKLREIADHLGFHAAARLPRVTEP